MKRIFIFLFPLFLMSCTEKVEIETKSEYDKLKQEITQAQEKDDAEFLKIVMIQNKMQNQYWFCELVMCEGLHGKHKFDKVVLAEVKKIKPKLNNSMDSVSIALRELLIRRNKRDSITWDFEKKNKTTLNSSTSK